MSSPRSSSSADSSPIALKIRHKGYRVSAYERAVVKQKGEDALIEIRNRKGVLQSISIPQKHWQWYGSLPQILPAGTYVFQGLPKILHGKPIDTFLGKIALAMGLGRYYFNRYLDKKRESSATIIIPPSVQDAVNPLIEGITLARDLINTPANDMGPAELALAAENLANEFKGSYSVVSGKHLKKEYPLVSMVGQGAEDTRAPRFVEMAFTHKKASKTIALVGKGVCFDSGGLDIKPGGGMLLMKKDMGGAAIVLGLAKALLMAKVPLNLKLYLPMVENAVDAASMRPMDIVKARSGKTVEIADTDAEGRLILAEALTRACEDNPDLIIDVATLTGAARVAVGADISAFFTNNADVASDIYRISEEVDDPMWQLPLYQPYRDSLNTPHADIKNISAGGYGGAITAALFLEEFVSHTIPWLHIDTIAWNLKSRPSYPEGGEAMALRALFRYLEVYTL